MTGAFPRPRPESWQSRFWCWGLNLWPCVWGTGGRVTYMAADWHEAHVALLLSFRTRNLVGTIFGGSMYGIVDPIYMLMLHKVLGEEYIVWDKAACIRFRKPGKGTLYARFVISAEELENIRALAAQNPSIDRTYPVELVDKNGVVHATFEKVLYIRRKDRQSSTLKEGVQS